MVFEGKKENYIIGETNSSKSDCFGRIINGRQEPLFSIISKSVKIRDSI